VLATVPTAGIVAVVDAIATLPRATTHTLVLVPVFAPMLVLRLALVVVVVVVVVGLDLWMAEGLEASSTAAAATMASHADTHRPAQYACTPLALQMS
jgi:hypothetical protein